MQITFEFDLTLYRVDREVYSILDWVGDIGGLTEGLFVIFSMLLNFAQFNYFQHYMIEDLYKKKPKHKKSKSRQKKEGEDESNRNFDDRKTSWVRQKLI